MAIIAEKVSGTTNASTAVDVTLPQLPSGRVIDAVTLALYNESGEAITVQFGVLEMGNFVGFGVKDTVANNDATFLRSTIILREQEILSARCTGAALKGKVTFYVTGSLRDLDPPPIPLPVAQPGASY